MRLLKVTISICGSAYLALDSHSPLADYRNGEDEKMLTFLENATPRVCPSTKSLSQMRCVRPSLLDLRFTGDPWVVEHEDGSASVRLDDYRLARIETLPFDLPSLNQLLLQLRQWQIRRRFFQQLRARRLS